MKISYDIFEEAFLSKVTEFEFLKLPETNRMELMNGYLRRAASEFRKNCRYKLDPQDDIQQFNTDVCEDDVDELVEIISEGMLVQWLKPYLYKQELLENTLNTNDYSTYSSANLLQQVREAYAKVQRDYTQKIREYSYNHGDLRRLHL